MRMLDFSLFRYVQKSGRGCFLKAVFERGDKEAALCVRRRAQYVLCKLESNPGLVRWMRWQWVLMTTSIDRHLQPHLIVNVLNSSWRVLHINQAAWDLQGRPAISLDVA